MNAGLPLSQILKWGGRVLSAGNGLLAVVLFFMPWITVSCGGQELLSMSGWELAKGESIQGEEVGGNPMLFLILAFAVIAILLALVPWRETLVLGGIEMAIAILGLSIMLLLMMGSTSDRRQAASLGIEITYRPGFFGTILSFSGLMLGGGMMVAGQLIHSKKPVRPQKRAPSPSFSPAFAPRDKSYTPALRNKRRTSALPAYPSAPFSSHEAFLEEVPELSEEKTSVDSIPHSQPVALLRFQKGPWAGQEVPLYSDNILIGRGSACDIRIPDKYVSRSHARLRYAQGHWFIQDQNSTGGTYVNGQQVRATRLQSGDRVRLGKDTEFLFVKVREIR